MIFIFDSFEIRRWIIFFLFLLRRSSSSFDCFSFIVCFFIISTSLSYTISFQYQYACNHIVETNQILDCNANAMQNANVNDWHSSKHHINYVVYKYIIHHLSFDHFNINIWFYCRYRSSSWSQCECDANANANDWHSLKHHINMFLRRLLSKQIKIFIANYVRERRYFECEVLSTSFFAKDINETIVLYFLIIVIHFHVLQINY